MTSSWPTATRSAIHPGPQSASPSRSQSGARRATSAAAEAEAGSATAAGRAPAATGQPARRRLARSPIGVVPITWNNVDLTDLAPEVPAATVLDACAELGFEGVQLGRGFPQGGELRAALRDRNLRLAEVYAELPMSPDGPSDDAVEIGRERLALLHEGGGDVLVAACRRRRRTRGVGGPRRRPRRSADCPSRLAPPRRRPRDARRPRPARPAGRSRSTPTPARTSRRRPRSGASPLQPTRRRVAICLDAGHCHGRRRRRRRARRGARAADPPRPREGRRPGRPRRSPGGSPARLRRGDPGPPVHGARPGHPRRRRPRRRARGDRLRRLADGRAGQHVARPGGVAPDRPGGAPSGPSPR